MSGFGQLALVVVLNIAFAAIAGPYLARVYATEPGRGPLPSPGDRVFSPIERIIFKSARIETTREQTWSVYTLSMLAFSTVSIAFLYFLERIQSLLPLNPTRRSAVPAWGALNTAVSFVTNTNWQWYSGESTMSHFTQMVGLTVQNFVSAAAGMAVCVALIRGICRRSSNTLGNFWVDLVRGVVRVLLPLSFVFALVLLSQGVIQNFKGSTTAVVLDQSKPAQTTTQATAQATGSGQNVQMIPGGPVASQEAIKQIGTNGGGFFGANSAHPFENPNGLSNLLETVAITAVPFAFCIAFGRMVGDRRQGFVLAAVMLSIWIAMSGITMVAEQAGNHNLGKAGIQQQASATQSGGNMEGKDVRFGPSECAIWTGSTTGTSNGSVNCSLDSFTPMGELGALAHMMLGEISPGGVGVGMMGMLVNALLAVFIAGLMVGRTPEYLGKKIQAAEMKLVTLLVLAVPMVLLSLAAATVMLPSARRTITAAGPHGLSEVLYNFASAANNNGSAFGGLASSSNWYTITQSIAMLVGRFFLIIPAMAIGGSLARKPKVPTTSGTFPTHTALFGGLVVGVVFILAGLTYFPALALGPILEHLTK